MILIPRSALKYILFQRTDFSIYTVLGWPLRIVMNKRIPIYNAAVHLEALLLPGRTKKLFSLDMEREYNIIKAYLPSDPKNILDIGCGVAGIDVMLEKHYSGAGKDPYFYLLDKSEVNSKVYYGIEKQAAYYNSLDIAKKIMVTNRAQESRVHTQEVTGAPIFPGVKFGLIVSLLSWGFHYPTDTYLDYAYDSLVPGGMLVIDIRKGTDGEAKLEKKFGRVESIYEGKKHKRIIVSKK